MKKHIRSIIIILLCVAVLVSIDQITKYMVRTSLTDHDISIIDGVFRLRYSRNTGAVWGLFKDFTTGLIIISSLILAGVIYILAKLPHDSKKHTVMRVLCVFIMSGAIGNLIDRVFLSYVVDFLYFELIDFPIFNIADCYITCSVILLAILLIFYFKDEDLDFLKLKKKDTTNV